MHFYGVWMRLKWTKNVRKKLAQTKSDHGETLKNSTWNYHLKLSTLTLYNVTFKVFLWWCARLVGFYAAWTRLKFLPLVCVSVGFKFVCAADISLSLTLKIIVDDFLWSLALSHVCGIPLLHRAQDIRSWPPQGSLREMCPAALTSIP